MALPTATFPLLPFANWLAYSAANGPLGNYPKNTKRYLESGITFVNPAAENKLWFPKEGGICLDVIHPALRSKVDMENGHLSVVSNQLPACVTGGKLMMFTHVAPWNYSQMKEIEPDEDQHAELTKRAIYGLGIGTRVLFYDQAPHPMRTLTQEVAYVDIPPVAYGSFVGFFGLMFDPQRGNARHALRGVVFNESYTEVRVQTAAETRAGIRSSLDKLLTEIFEIQQALKQNPPNMETGVVAFVHRLKTIIGAPEEESTSKWWEGIKAYGQVASNPSNMDQLWRRLDRMEKDFQAGRYVDVIKEMEALRPTFFFPELRNFRFPKDYYDLNYLKEHKELLDELMAPYRTVAQLIQNVQNSFFQAESGSQSAFQAGVEHLRNLLRYIPEEDWPTFAPGKGLLTAIGQLKIAALLHLVQDSVAHCRDYDPRGDICANPVTNTFFKLGPQHLETDDQLTTPTEEDDDDVEKPTVQLAVYLSQQSYRIAALSDSKNFLAEKATFLNKYWPAP